MPKQESKIEDKIENLPKHVAVILDGNRRWAKEKGLPPLEGHRKGAENFGKIVEKAKEMGIECLTAWAFSTENWKRSKQEVRYLFRLIEYMAKKYKDKCEEEKVRFVHLGRKDRIPKSLSKLMTETEEKTKKFKGLTVALAIDYGGHDELIRALKEINEKNLEITPENIEAHLDTVELPQIDLIIRPGKEKRLSGFMSWQCAYAELYFSNVHFPAFDPDEFEKAIKEFSLRKRRFGGN